MKLTTQQIETIEHYLLDWGLEYEDFYDEVLDHFITKIESIMLNEKSDFRSAFLLTKKDFSGRKFKNNIGLKAFEAEFENGLLKSLKDEIIARVKSQFSSWRILVWSFIAWLVYQYSLEFDDRYIVAIIAGIITFQIYVFFKAIDWNKKFLSSRWLLPKEELSSQKRKTQYLYSKTRSRVLLKYTVLFVPFFILISNFSTTSIPVLKWASLASLLILFSFVWAHFELLWSERKS